MDKLSNSFIPDFLIGLAGSFEYRRLRSASRNPRKSQEKTLRAILSRSKNTQYGRDHDFRWILEAKDDTELYKRYQQKVAAQDYEAMRPYIDRIKQGAADVLFPGRPMMYATTSGTTKEPKWVPITIRYLLNIYGMMTRAWLYNFMRHRPKVFWGKIISLVSPAVEGYAPDGLPYGSVSGVTRRDCPFFIRKRYTTPFEVYEIKDYTSRYYALMRMSIERNTSLCALANPSSILEMQNVVDKYYDLMCDDIEHGTLSETMQVDDRIRKACKSWMKPNPARARELRELKQQYGRVLPKHYWPDLQLVSCWHCGNTKIYYDKLQDFFPEHTFKQEIGYFSTECRFGLVLDETDYTVLFPHMHYYEFVEEHDMQSEHPTFLQLWQLEPGKRYCSFVTTYNGMFRYDMSDLVEVAPSPFEQTPRIFMVQKINGIVSMTGEKLHEHQFINAVHATEEALAMPCKFFVGFADLELSAYHFYYEFAKRDTTQAEAEQFTTHLDELLKEENIEYQAKRDSFRVKEPVTHRLEEFAFEKFKEACIKEGYRDGQFKLNLLMQDEKRHAKFKKLVLE